MDSVITSLGAAAAALTSLSFIPQVKKAWPRKSTEDISLKMFSALTIGLVLWVIYGVLKSDWVIVLANAVGALLAGAVLCFKFRDMYAGQGSV